MAWSTLLIDLGFFTVGISAITVFIQYFSKKMIEAQINIFENEHIHRFTTLYSEKINVVKETFIRVVQTERAFRNLTTPAKSSDEKQRNEKDAVDSLNSLFDFYEENELLLDDTSLELIKKMKIKFVDVLNAYNSAMFIENQMSGNEKWVNAIENLMKVSATVLDNEIPAIKKQLKKDFQKKYKLIEIEK